MLTIKKKLAPSWFTLKSSREPAPEFLLAPLSACAFLDVREEVRAEEGGGYTITGRGVTDALRASVKNWRNVAGEDGQPAEFSIADLLDLPAQVQFDLAIEIVNRAVMWEIERKNSRSPST